MHAVLLSMELLDKLNVMSCLQRNPFYPKQFMSVGDWTAKVSFVYAVLYFCHFYLSFRYGLKMQKSLQSCGHHTVLMLSLMVAGVPLDRVYTPPPQWEALSVYGT